MEKNNIKGKFVCVFGRDKGYYQEKFEDPRNFKFYSFKKLIKKLIQLNYTVIRMGRKIMRIFYSIIKNILILMILHRI